MRIAYFSPFPPSGSGVAHLTGKLLPLLSRKAEVDLFIDDIHPALMDKEPCNSYHHLRFPSILKEKGYDSIIYNIGNSEHHYYILNYISRYRGIIFLHEDVLHHSLAKYHLKNRDYPGYIKELSLNYPKDNERVLDIFRFVSAGIGDDRLYEQYPMSEFLIRASCGIIVMSRQLKESVNRRFPGIPVKKINLPFFMPAENNASSGPVHKQKRGETSFIVGIFGMISHYKRIFPILSAVRALSGRLNIKTVIAGKTAPDIDLNRYIEDNKLMNVHYYGYLPHKEFISLIGSSSLVVNLRYPSFGEMSAALIDALGMGKPVMLYDTPQFEDIPDDAVIKIGPGIDEENTIANKIRHLYNNREILEKTGKKAREYILNNHMPEQAVDGILDLVSEIQEKPGINLDYAEYGSASAFKETIIDKHLQEKDIPEERKNAIRGQWRQPADPL